MRSHCWALTFPFHFQITKGPFLQSTVTFVEKLSKAIWKSKYIMSSLSTYLLPPPWTSSRPVREDCPLQKLCCLLPLTSHFPMCTVVLRLCCRTSDGSQTHQSVVPQDLSSWQLWRLCPPPTLRPFLMTVHTLGQQFCSFTCEPSRKWCLVLLVYWPPAYLFGLICPVNSVQIDLALLMNCYQEYVGFGALPYVFSGKDWYIKLTEYFCCFLVFPKCFFTYLSSN